MTVVDVPALQFAEIKLPSFTQRPPLLHVALDPNPFMLVTHVESVTVRWHFYAF